ncbi:MAG: NAD(P)/FAD-dependent oxidoreductase [Pseudonocardiaceae bacterium]
MTHRIVVIGAGYAGLATTVRLAGRLQPDDARVTLVNAAPGFVERVRLHQVAAGQRVPDLALRDAVRGTGVELVLGRVRSVDPDGGEVWVDEPDGPHVLGYDTLVYALGSTADVEGVAGVADHALTVAGFDDAQELRSRVSALAAEGAVLGVVGGGSTGIEAATELAESHPGVRVRLLTGDELGGWLSPRAREHLRRVLDRLGIDVREGAKVVEVQPDGVVLADGDCVGADAVLWTTGFRVSPLAREAGLSVDGRGRVLVDDTLRSLSHPDVYAVGDAAAVPGPDGRELRMACATAIPTGRHAADAIASRLAGRRAAPLRFRYLLQCLSLGRRDGVIQFLHADDSARDGVLTGRAAALVKEAIVRGAAWTARRPGPTRCRADRAAPLSGDTSPRRC